jgi:CRP-like cAMP-binding protein
VYTRLMHEKLVGIARAASFARGARLVRQGEASRGAFILRTGEAEAQVALPGGGTLAVAHFLKGDMFGEMALIERGVCSASVIAREAVEAWFIERDDFRAMVASRDPAALEIQRDITRVLAARLRTLNTKVRAHPSAEDRPGRPPEAQPCETREPSFDWRKFLPLLAFFEGFDAYEIDELLGRCRALGLERGAWLFVPGQPASACYVVLRGAVEILSFARERQRRVALAGPGELVGHLAVLDGEARTSAARVRETACVLELPAGHFLEIYHGGSGTSVSLQHAIHKSLLRALARTNTQLTRLISHAHLTAGRDAAELERALHGQVVQSSSLTET